MITVYCAPRSKSFVQRKYEMKQQSLTAKTWDSLSILIRTKNHFEACRPLVDLIVQHVQNRDTLYKTIVIKPTSMHVFRYLSDLEEKLCSRNCQDWRQFFGQRRMREAFYYHLQHTSALVSIESSPTCSPTCSGFESLQTLEILITWQPTPQQFHDDKSSGHLRFSSESWDSDLKGEQESQQKSWCEIQGEKTNIFHESDWSPASFYSRRCSHVPQDDTYCVSRIQNLIPLRADSQDSETSRISAPEFCTFRTKWYSSGKNL